MRETIDRHQPQIWLSDRYSTQQGHSVAQQTCLTCLARDVAYVIEASDKPVPFRLKLWFASAFALAHLAASLAAPTACDLVGAFQARLRRVCDQLLAFAD